MENSGNQNKTIKIMETSIIVFMSLLCLSKNFTAFGKGGGLFFLAMRITIIRPNAIINQKR
jgi:hypothetical protein